jgi:acetyl esterase/lipase
MSTTLRAFPVVALLVFAVAAAGCRPAAVEPPITAGAAPRPMTAEELIALPHHDPDRRLAYGPDSSQYGELRLPAGPGPHPVVVLVHGGCWRADFATAASIAAMADALQEDGIASWSIEYRRLHEPGGGWPGTYEDVGRAVDELRALAGPYHLDLSRVVVVGHSAGGHLAMWVAARSRLPEGSTLYRADPLPIRGVVDLDGTPDMADGYREMDRVCGEDVVEAMAGGTPVSVPEHFAQVSAIEMLPLGVPQVLVWGRRDDQVPLALAERYLKAARRAGDPVRLVVDPEAGHFEAASPKSALWPSVHRAIRSLLDGQLPS